MVVGVIYMLLCIVSSVEVLYVCVFHQCARCCVKCVCVLSVCVRNYVVSCWMVLSVLIGHVCVRIDCDVVCGCVGLCDVCIVKWGCVYVLCVVCVMYAIMWCCESA